MTQRIDITEAWTNLTWYLDYIAGGHELRVIDELIWQGFDVWRGAVQVEVVRSADRKPGQPRVEVVEKPALRNWIFAHLTDQERCDFKHKQLAGAVPVSKRDMRDVHRFMAEVERMEVLKSYQPGDLLEITGGALMGQMMELIAVETDAVRLKIALLGKTGEVRVPVGDVVRVDK